MSLKLLHYKKKILTYTFAAGVTHSVLLSFSMVVKGYKQPLVQDDMWDLNLTDSTACISQHFQYFMQTELGAARVRYQSKLKQKLDQIRRKGQEETFLNGVSNGLGKGVSQDVLVMVSGHLHWMHDGFSSK